MSRFDYIIDKVKTAPMLTEPFKHIYIADLFSPEDFAEITSSREINVERADSDEDLFEKLYAAGYKVIEFPGCIVDQDAYLAWHKNRDREGQEIHTACEGYGMTLRLIETGNGVLAELKEFLAGKAFNQALAGRYGIDLDDCRVDGGIQKYLDGYEISPHPDIRRKAATFMVNINPHANSEALNHHTHYMRMTPERAYVREFWEENGDFDRCWVPWDWCETRSMQPVNNSMVIFSPSNETMHGVKADYDHLAGQRTQLYGNLWYKEMPAMSMMEWEDLAAGSMAEVKARAAEIAAARKAAEPAADRSIKGLAKSLMPKGMKKALRKVVGGGVAEVPAAKDTGSDTYHQRTY